MSELIERAVGGTGHRLEQFKLWRERASVRSTNWPVSRAAWLTAQHIGRDIGKHKLEVPYCESVGLMTTGIL